LNSGDYVTESWESEVNSGERFQFGENWAAFIQDLSEARIEIAQDSLSSMLGLANLKDKTFLDIGSGSGLFSLAAYRLGANVVSFDFDEDSVRCTQSLCDSVAGQDRWQVRTGSVLDLDYLRTLEVEFGPFDILYSWGVLHHTGKMWNAISNVISIARPNALIYIAIYNDQGFLSKFWSIIKKTYCKCPRPLRGLILFPAFIILWAPAITLDLLSGRGFNRWRDYKSKRGMSPWRDVVDWVGGYPFEAAKPDEILSYFKERNFVVQNMTKTKGHGCCQYVFKMS